MKNAIWFLFVLSKIKVGNTMQLIFFLNLGWKEH